jgi:hypothetical protein
VTASISAAKPGGSTFTHRGERHVARLGKNISRTVAGELARVERAAVLKREAGISKRQAKYQRRMSSLLACRQFESPGK